MECMHVDNHIVEIAKSKVCDSNPGGRYLGSGNKPDKLYSRGNDD